MNPEIEMLLKTVCIEDADISVIQDEFLHENVKKCFHIIDTNFGNPELTIELVDEILELYIYDTPEIYLGCLTHLNQQMVKKNLFPGRKEHNQIYNMLLSKGHYRKGTDIKTVNELSEILASIEDTNSQKIFVIEVLISSLKDKFHNCYERDPDFIEDCKVMLQIIEQHEQNLDGTQLTGNEFNRFSVKEWVEIFYYFFKSLDIDITIDRNRDRFAKFIHILADVEFYGINNSPFFASLTERYLNEELYFQSRINYDLIILQFKRVGLTEIAEEVTTQALKIKSNHDNSSYLSFKFKAVEFASYQLDYSKTHDFNFDKIIEHSSSLKSTSEKILYILEVEACCFELLLKNHSNAGYSIVEDCEREIELLKAVEYQEKGKPCFDAKFGSDQLTEIFHLFLHSLGLDAYLPEDINLASISKFIHLIRGRVVTKIDNSPVLKSFRLKKRSNDLDREDDINDDSPRKMRQRLKTLVSVKEEYDKVELSDISQKISSTINSFE
ncbi:hypothetical protein EO244_14050 [Ancylomarina salipaludis]|uniref:Uncharacterized protein n=1 Tax=Ancylomarina salipaludis TaxID=2501299 RepID=A0A4Q1JJT6_9BACT|nr:hypothetical protein [Ancylomarina salipaludis]RXQ89485.1 hypothetical protein EO244_14050 [Ancylomarina salipaludis]